MFHFPNRDRKYDWIRALVETPRTQQNGQGTVRPTPAHLLERSHRGSVSSVSTEILGQNDQQTDGNVILSLSNENLQESNLRAEDQPNAESQEGNPENKQEADIIDGPKSSMWLKRYFDMMYYFGICSFLVKENPDTSRCTRWILDGFQMLTFWFIAITSCFESVCQVKYNYLGIKAEHEYNSYVAFAYGMACLLAKVYVVYLLWFKQEKIVEMLTIMETYENNASQYDKKAKPSNWKVQFVTLLALTTLALAGTKAIAMGGDSAEELVLTASLELSEDIFLWNSATKLNDSNDLERDFGVNLTITTITMGSFLLLRNTASYLQMGMFFDLIMLLGLVMHAYTTPFMQDVVTVTKNVSKGHFEQRNELQKRREAAWERYRNIRAVFAAVNGIFDPLFKLLHVRNLMTYAYFMTMIVFGGSSFAASITHGINLLKAELGYYIAGKIAEQNDVIRDWIRNWALFTGKIHVHDEDMDAGIVLDELDREPIGLGKGSFLIHQTFHYKFVGLVWSVFFSMAKEDYG